MVNRISLPFFFQAEDGIRDGHVTGVQTCALPISREKPAFCVAASEVSPAASRSSRSFRARRRRRTVGLPATVRSEERRVGKEWRTRGARPHGNARVAKSRGQINSCCMVQEGVTGQ